MLHSTNNHLTLSRLARTCDLQGVLPGLKGPVSLSDKGRRVRTSVTHTKGWSDYILWAPVGAYPP